MAEPVDPAADWLATRGAARPVAVAVYADRVWAEPVPGRGVRGSRKTRKVPAADGGEVVETRATWWLAWPGDRPTLRTKITDGADVWVVESFGRDPLDGVAALECVLA